VETAETTEHARHTAQSTRFQTAVDEHPAESSRLKRTTVSAAGLRLLSN
jgi:hypothetical protein